MALPQEIITLMLKGNPTELRKFLEFTNKDSDNHVAVKFKAFSRRFYPRFFEQESAPFHDDMLMDYIQSYRHGVNLLEIAFRGAAKTSLLKLFVVYVLIFDKDQSKKYIKFLTRDGKNSRQFVTDVYNLIVEVRGVFGNLFAKEDDKKRETTMLSFTMLDGRKLGSGTVGQSQRGHVQDAYRPDWVLGDDVEDRDSISSVVITQGIIDGIDEAFTGLSIDGNWCFCANYISDTGVVERLKGLADFTRITPIMDMQGNITWSAITPNKVEEYRKSLDFFGEYMCLHPDTLVLTIDGLKAIKDVVVGDVVITHKGRPQNVLKVFENHSDEMLDITVEGKVTTITRDHPVLAVREGVEEWVNAGDLREGDLLVTIRRGKLLS